MTQRIIIELQAIRRNLNCFIAPIILFVLGFVMASPQSIFAGEITLEDNSLSVAFDSHSGALTRLEDKTSHWIIERRPKLGVAFRLFAPLPERNWNPVFIGNTEFDNVLFGPSPKQNQHVAKVKKVSTNEIHIQWKNPVSENGNMLPTTFTSVVTLTNGVLTFNATLDNNSSLKIDTIDYPYLGDLNPSSKSAPLAVSIMRNGKPSDLQTTEIYPHFNNENGYWGDFYPLKTREANQSPFCLIQSVGEGLYVGMDVVKPPYQMQYTFELHPGVISSVSNLVPEADEISGHPVYLQFRTCHFISLKPHSEMKLAPIVMRFYQGDWHVGVKLYKH